MEQQGQRRKYQGEHERARPSAPSLVAQHYNERPDVGAVKRKESRIIRMRSFNNWIKSVLINRYVGKNQTVFDMGCGKGGDLIKWSKAGISHLVAADIASVSLEQMKERYLQLRQRPFTAEFHPMDCYSELISPKLKKEISFDAVSMQFCLHYAFENEHKARIMLQNVSQRLRSGGYFIGTIPDANLIVKRLRQDQKEGFGNSIYSITFDNLKKDESGKLVGFTPFGCKYMFHLVDAVDCPEYLVNWRVFENLAGEYGLKLKFKENFHDFYVSATKEEDYSRLLERIGVVGGRNVPDMTQEEWEAAGIYLAFAFQKQ